jgi:hypothetical protein
VLEPVRQAFVNHATRKPLQEKVESLMDDGRRPKVASWFVCDPRGTQVAAVFDRETSPTIGHNFAYRSYFHGGPKDLPASDAAEHRPTDQTHLSAPLQSTATRTLKMAVSTPIYSKTDPTRCLGILALTVEVGNFLTFTGTENQFAVLVEGRDSGFTGAILHHPLFTRVYGEKGSLPARYSDYRVTLDKPLGDKQYYRDPLSEDPDGGQFDRQWIAAIADVELLKSNGQRSPSGLIVLVQEAKDTATAPVRLLGNRLVFEGLFALAGVLLVVFLLWYFVLRVFGDHGLPASANAPAARRTSTNSATPRHNRPTLPSPRLRK